MRVIILGQGGREHALAWRLSLDEQVKEIYVLPGNPGMELTPKVQCLPVELNVAQGLATVIKSLAADLVVVGPEAPLCQGIVDLFIKHEITTPIFGPDAKAARLEGSKVFAKEFMHEFGIPTAEYKSFDELAEALTFADRIPWDDGAVVKADELASGKGVVVCSSKKEIKNACTSLMDAGDYGFLSQRLVIERKLKGQELSAFALCDGEGFFTLGFAQDYKRLKDFNEGPNTGGMGCSTPENLVSKELRERIETDVFKKVVDGMLQRGTPFKGVLYAGLMLEGDDFQVLEFNVRFGDPEAQTLLPLLEGPFFELLKSCSNQTLSQIAPLISLSQKKAIHVVMTSKGYPGLFGEKLLLNQNISFEDTLLTHNKDGPYGFMSAVKKNQHGEFVNTGGRVMGITCTAETLDQARVDVYEALKRVNFDGAFWRKDIGKNALDSK